MILRPLFAFLVQLLLLGPHALRAQAAPKVVSLFPLGGQRGTALQVEVHGAGLEGAYAVWLGPGTRLHAPWGADAPYTRAPGGLRAHVKTLADGSRANLQLTIAPDARLGFHSLALVAPSGLSGSISFWVGPHPVLQAAAAPHSTPETAQPLKLPCAVNGRLADDGRPDYYAFTIARAQTVAFEVVSSYGPHVEPYLALEPQLALHEAGGSFLDPRHSRRLVFREEITQGSMPASRRMTYHFTKPGPYLVGVGSRLARGAAGYAYLLRISAADQPAVAEDALSWAQQRLQQIRSRAVGAPAAQVALVKEAEPNDDPRQANAFQIPAVLEGTIGGPGDIDYYRFRAGAGRKLAFEVQTPHARPPQFNPRLDILNARGAVVLSNVRLQDGKIGTAAGKVVRLAPEVLGKLDEEGEYTLRVRDLTALQGSPDHVYRVLVRSQVPHLGAVRLEADAPINLRPGARQRVTLRAPAKEDFSGTLALCAEGLPQGVKAFVGAGNSTIDLVADPAAPCGLMPQVLRISGLPLLGEKSGPPFLVGEIPVMVVKK